MGSILTANQDSITPVSPPPVTTPTADISAPDKPGEALPEIPNAPTAEEVQPPISAPEPVAAPIEPIPVPSIEEMEEELKLSGLLLPELHVSAAPIVMPVDTSPLASLQPGYQAPKEEFFSAPVANSPVQSLSRQTVVTSVGQNSITHPAVSNAFTDNEVQVGVPLRLPLEPLMAVVLCLLAAIGITQVAYFGLHQYPRLEMQMISGRILATDLQTASLKAFAVAGLSALSILFAALVMLYRHDKRVLTILAGCIVVAGASFAMQNFVAIPDLLPGNPAALFTAWTSLPPY